MSLPPPSKNQPFWKISTLEAGHLYGKASRFLDNAAPDAQIHLPCLAYLLQHSVTNENFLFDLGLRKDLLEKGPPKLLEYINSALKVEVPDDVVDALAKGGLTPLDIQTVCLSHLHFDHVGYTPPFSKSTFVVGGETRRLFDGGFWPENPNSHFPADILPPEERMIYLGDDVKWESVGPFPKAHDYFNDGSLYIVDAPGHIWGHTNLLARTSADGAWAYLCGDTAHHWNLIQGTSNIACMHPGKAFSHVDKALAEEMIGRVRELMKIPRVRVLLGHDKPFFEAREGFFPEQIESL
ncbi:hypothetical protein NP233_g11707 [Leucocoprinus birnbaumii]|uniref:Metallo-beta-lactamase domain-containing protein n=1 Tax=Leucocoprinus birnbaumii TaxID=56174 RepID=A0AAD5YQP6_9AGAR|nr:hypothetical protein NP233_g11707 [Leucocoprinus birnbaumii]